MKRLALALFAFSALAFGQAFPGGGTSSSGTGAAPYIAPFAAVTGLTVTAATHGQGLSPYGVCFDNAAPANLIAQTAGFPTVSATGQIVFAWTGSKTGNCTVTSLGVGPAGALASNVEYSSNQTINTAVDCPSSIKTFTGSSPITLIWVAPLPGCSIIIQNNSSATLTENVTGNSLTVNGVSGSNLSIPACASPAAGCLAQRWSANGSTSWDVGYQPTGAAGATGATGSTGATGAAGTNGTNGSSNVISAIPNDGVTGTTNAKLAKINSAGNLVIIGTGDVSVPPYCVLSGGGTTGNPTIAVAGVVTCTVEAAGGVTASHFMVASGTTAGTLHDAGATAPTSGWVIGTAQASASANATVQIALAGYNASAGGGGVSQVVCGNGLSGGTITTTGTCAVAPQTNAQTASYNPVAADCGNIIKVSSATNVSMVFPQAGATGFSQGCRITVINNNLGGLILATATTSVFNYNGSSGRANYFQGIDNTSTYISDGTNWDVDATFPQTLFIKQADSCVSAPASASQTIGYSGFTVACAQAATGSGSASAAVFGTGTFTFPANFIGATTWVRYSCAMALTSSGGALNFIHAYLLGGSNLLAGSQQSINLGANSNLVQAYEIDIFGTASPNTSVSVAAAPVARANLLNMDQQGAAGWFQTGVNTTTTLALTQTGLYSANTAGNWSDVFRCTAKWMTY